VAFASFAATAKGAHDLNAIARSQNLLLTLVALAPLAAAGSLPARLGRFLAERAGDLLDVVEVNLGVGPGAKFHLAYGVQFFGIGDVRARRLGTLDRRLGTWRELDTELGLFPLSLFAWPVHHAAKLTGLRGLAASARFVAQDGSDGFRHLDRKELNGDPAFILRDTVSGPLHASWGESFSFGIEAHALVGGRARIRPLQFADFLLGFVGLDLDPWLQRAPEE